MTDTLDVLKGYGETLHIGDVVYRHLYFNGELEDQENNKEGPYLVEKISADLYDPWMKVRSVLGQTIFNYRSFSDSDWYCKFTLADKEIVQKFESMIPYFDMYVRVYIKINKNTKLVLIPVPWILYTGDLKKSFLTYPTLFGRMKEESIIRWTKTAFYKDRTMKSKVSIPKEFPINLKSF